MTAGKRLSPGRDRLQSVQGFGRIGLVKLNRDSAKSGVSVMLIRFCLLRRDTESHSPQGVFQAAIELRDSGQLETYEEEWLERDLAWLRMHLHSPDCLRDDGNHRAISWFKPGARNAIDKVRGIVALLESRGITVRMITTVDAGTIVYEDGWQVVAKPWRARAKRVRRANR